MNIADLFSREDRDQLEKWCRSQTQQSYLGSERALCRVLGKYLMYVDTHDQSLAPHLLMNGFWEMWVTIAIARHVKPGMVCVDAGANCGYYTLLLSDLVGERGRVMAYEPQASLVHSLMGSIKINGFGGVATCLGVALGSQTGAERLHVSAIDLGAGSLSSKASLYPQGGYTSIVMLDSNTELEKGPVDFVKIDVQGYELEVLRGMKETIARSPKIAIAMEFTPSEHTFPMGALDEIQGMGLTIRTIGTDGTVRAVNLNQAATADTGDHRMLWLTRT